MGQLVPQHDLNESSQISLRSAQLGKQFVGGHSMAPWSRKRQRSRAFLFRCARLRFLTGGLPEVVLTRAGSTLNGGTSHETLQRLRLLTDWPYLAFQFRVLSGRFQEFQHR